MNLFDSNWLSIGSLVLGFIGLIIPIFGIFYHKKVINRNSVLVLCSLGACATALWLQIAYNNYLVSIRDLSSLMDTIGTLNQIAAILLIGTIVLNLVSIMPRKKRALTQ